MKFVDLNQGVQDQVLALLKKYKWILMVKEYPYMIRIRKKYDYSIVRMNIHWNGKGRITKIATHMLHPKKGKRQMYRTINTIEDLEKYLINPRQHSKVGYSKKK